MRKAIIWGVCAVALAGTAVRLELRNRVPWNSVLEINLSGAPDGPHGVSGASVIPANSSSDAMNERDLERAIDTARDDKRVVGLMLRIGEANRDMQMVKEIAARLAAFRTAGKTVVCAAIDEDGDGANILVAACDKRISESVSMDEGADDYFDAKFGEDNWSAIEVREYLKRVKHGD